jgi:uncharacterized glyoxalase superfamily protein PhnB
MLTRAIPVLHVSDSKAAEAQYGQRLGFNLRFAYRPDDARADPCYLGLERDVVWLHLSSFAGDGVGGGVAIIMVDDVDALYAELAANDVTIDLPPTDQTWGTREMYVKDADRNTLRFIQDARR